MWRMRARPTLPAAQLRLSELRILKVWLVLMMAAAGSAWAQTYTVLHNFAGGPDGATPLAALTLDAAGNLYGTTSVGGGSCPDISGVRPGCGTAFELSPTSSGWVETILHVFLGGHDGAYPESKLVFGPDGNLYGTTHNGGAGTAQRCGTEGCGTVYKLTPPPAGCQTCSWTEQVIYSFNGQNDDEADPTGTLAFDAAGNIYGTTYGGVVYELSPSASGWTETVLATLDGFTNGQSPQGGVILDAHGNLYGPVASYGEGIGAIFQLVNTGSGWTENLLYSFLGGSDGSAPEGGLIFDRLGSGCLFGTASTGPGNGKLGSGVLFSLCPQGGGWSFTSEHIFDPPGLLPPRDSLLQDAAGNLYGTWGVSAYEFGAGGYSTLHFFTGGENGVSFGSGLIMDGRGNLYGTAAEGGTGQLCVAYGCGLVYEIRP